MTASEHPDSSSWWHSKNNTSEPDNNQSSPRAFNVYANFHPHPNGSGDFVDGSHTTKEPSGASFYGSSRLVTSLDYTSNTLANVWEQSPKSLVSPYSYPVNTPIEHMGSPQSIHNQDAAAMSNASRSYIGTSPSQIDARSRLCCEIEFRNVPQAYEQSLINLAKALGDLKCEPSVCLLANSITFRFFDTRVPSKLFEKVLTYPQLGSTQIKFKPLCVLEGVAIDIPWGVNFDQSQLCHTMSSYGDILDVQYEHNGAVNKLTAQDRLIFFYYDVRSPSAVPLEVIAPVWNNSLYVSTYKIMAPFRELRPPSDRHAFSETNIRDANTKFSYGNCTSSPGTSGPPSSRTASSLFGSIGSNNSDSTRGSTLNSYPSSFLSNNREAAPRNDPFDFSALHISQSEPSLPFLKHSSDIPRTSNVPDTWGGSRMSTSAANIPSRISHSGPSGNFAALNNMGIDPASSFETQQRMSQKNSMNRDVCMNVSHKHTEAPAVSNCVKPQRQNSPFSSRSRSQPNLASDHRSINFVDPFEAQSSRESQSTPIAQRENHSHAGVNHSPHSTVKSPSKPPTSSTHGSLKTKASSSSLRRAGNSAHQAPKSSSHGNLASTKIDIKAVESGKEQRTTVMVCNIPNKLEFDDFKQFIDETSAGKYEFLYLRFDFANRCNVGYAFVSFATPMDLKNFVEKRAGMKWNSQNYNSEKVIDVKFARIQGRESLVRKFRASPVMHQEPRFRPKFYCTEGPLAGKEIPF